MIKREKMILWYNMTIFKFLIPKQHTLELRKVRGGD